jgi:hypothetical protein
MNKYFYKDLKCHIDEDGHREIIENVPHTRFISKKHSIRIVLREHIPFASAKDIRDNLQRHEKNHRKLFDGWSNSELEADFN